MPRVTSLPEGPTDPRERLLRAAIELMSREGSTDWTLRRLAGELGTSHRMLIYHFGSLEGLLLAVVQEVELRQRARRARLENEYDDPAQAARALWQELSDPKAAAHERLFFELYAAALQGRAYAKPLLETSIDDWLPSLTASFAAATGDQALAAVDARLGVAVIRGLLLDQLATGDHRAVTEAHERYLELYHGLARSTATTDPS